jgi:predicted nucleic acid-binding protein
MMRIIIDTHLLIFREYNSFIPEKLQILLNLINKNKHQIYVHPLSVEELENDKNLTNKEIILSKVNTYLKIECPPNANDDHEFQIALKISQDFNNNIDDQLIYCVYKNCVDCLITEDEEILCKSKQLDLDGKILNIENAIKLLETSQFLESAQMGLNQNSKPELSFYKNGDFWLIGENSKERQIKDLAGLGFISFLLQFPNQYFSPIEVYHGRTFPDESPVYNKDEFAFSGDIFKLRLSKSNISMAQIKSLIKNLENRIEKDDFANEDDLTKSKNQLYLLTQSLGPKGQRDHKSQSEKARVNVTRRIKLALNRINEMVPEVGLYLNKSTIKCGDSFSYSPISGQEPTWNLIP